MDKGAVHRQTTRWIPDSEGGQPAEGVRMSLPKLSSGMLSGPGRYSPPSLRKSVGKRRKLKYVDMHGIRGPL